MTNKLKGTNCRQIFQDYFTGRLDKYIQLCKMNINSKRYDGVYLSTYKHMYPIMLKQREALNMAFNELDEQTQAIISNSFKNDGQTAEMLANKYNMTTNNIRRLVTQFRHSYADHGGTDETEKQLLQPISNQIKAEKKREHSSN
ncbi:hypothetical protein WVIC16_60085 [Weissella viridescens]|nr:hypothetical protein WVIC16_60085 [Weissella viridescens]